MRESFDPHGYGGLPYYGFACGLASPNQGNAHPSQSHSNHNHHHNHNHNGPDPSTPEASQPLRTGTMNTGTKTNLMGQTSYPTPSSDIWYRTNGEVEGTQRASDILNDRLNGPVTGLQGYPPSRDRNFPMQYLRETSQTSLSGTNGSDGSALGSSAAPRRHRLLSPTREQPSPSLTAFPLRAFPSRPVYRDLPVPGDRIFQGTYQFPALARGRLLASPMGWNGHMNANPPERPASRLLQWTPPDRYDPRDRPFLPLGRLTPGLIDQGDRGREQSPATKPPRLPWALDDASDMVGSYSSATTDTTCRGPRCGHAVANPGHGVERGNGYGNGNGNGHGNAPMESIGRLPSWLRSTTTTPIPTSGPNTPGNAPSNVPSPSPCLRHPFLDRIKMEARNGNGNGNGNGISENYGGDPLNPANQSANISDDENTALWLTNLPPDCTHKMLLTAIHDCGKVYACVVNPPTANNRRNNHHNRNYAGGNNNNNNNAAIQHHHHQHQQQHMTSAAKVVFFDRRGAEQLLSQAHQGRFTVNGFVPHVRGNRIRSAARDPGPQCRVLHIEGPPAIVNFAFLWSFFSSKFTFEVEDVFMVGIGVGVGVGQAPPPQALPPLQPPPPSSPAAAASLSSLSKLQSIFESGQSQPEQQQQQQQEEEQVQQQQRVRLEWRFGSYRCQAESARQSIHREKDRVDLPAREKALWDQVNIHYGVDPCGS